MAGHAVPFTDAAMKFIYLLRPGSLMKTIYILSEYPFRELSPLLHLRKRAMDDTRLEFIHLIPVFLCPAIKNIGMGLEEIYIENGFDIHVPELFAVQTIGRPEIGDTGKRGNSGTCKNHNPPGFLQQLYERIEIRHTQNL